MRWWLGLTFAAIVAVTSFSVAEVFNHRAAGALRQRAQDLAVGQSVSASQVTAKAIENGDRMNIAAGFLKPEEKLKDYAPLIDNSYIK